MRSGGTVLVVPVLLLAVLILTVHNLISTSSTTQQQQQQSLLLPTAVAEDNRDLVAASTAAAASNVATGNNTSGVPLPSPPPPPRVTLIAQYGAPRRQRRSDSSNDDSDDKNSNHYDALLHFTSQINRQYAIAHGHDYMILRGWFPPLPPVAAAVEEATNNASSNGSSSSTVSVEWYVMESRPVGVATTQQFDMASMFPESSTATKSETSPVGAAAENDTDAAAAATTTASTIATKNEAAIALVEGDSDSSSIGRMMDIPSASRATYNKVYVLQLVLYEPAFARYDRLLLLDADAMVYDFTRDIADLYRERGDFVLAAHRTKRTATTSSANNSDGGGGGGTGSINIGVTLWNVRNPHTAPIVQRWKERCLARVRRGRHDDDQGPLQDLIKYDLDQVRRDQVVLGAEDHEFHYGRGTFVKHFIRHDPSSWDVANPPPYDDSNNNATTKKKNSLAAGTARLDKMKRAALDICQIQHQTAVCELLRLD
jgi:hypothetical protein